MADRLFTKTHEWAAVEGDTATMGITDYAQNHLGDVVFMELPSPGTTVKKGESFGTIESTKTASDLYAPLSGEVIENNSALESEPGLINQDPYGKGWMIKIRLSDKDELTGLLDQAGYDTVVKEES